MIIDNAKYHHSKITIKKVEEVKNIELMYLPPYCSQINAIEHLWRDIRAKVTHNTCFNTFESLLEQVKSYLYFLNNNANTIKKICAFIC